MTAFSKSWCTPLRSYTITRTGTSYVRAQTALWNLKEGLKNATTGAWTVIASSNRSSVSTGDTWTSYTNVVRAASENSYSWPGSWMWLRSPAGARGPWYLLLDWTASADYRCSFTVSHSPPDLTHLSPYRVPAPVSPYVRLSNTVFADSYSGNYLDFVTLVVGDDGSFFYTWNINITPDGPNGETQGRAEWSIMFNIMDDIGPKDPYGICLWVFDGRLELWLRTAQSTKTFYGIDPTGTSITMSPVVRAGVVNSTGYVNWSVRSMADDKLRNKLVSEPIWMLCTTAGKARVLGRLSDIWWATNQPYNYGMGGFEGESLKVQKVGCLWVPADQPFGT